VWLLTQQFLQCQVYKSFNLETSIGLFPDVGASWFLPRIFNNDPRVGLYMGLTGEKLKGEELVKCGVATHYIKQEKFDILKNILIERIKPEHTLEDIQKLVLENTDKTYSKDHFEFPYYNEIQKVFEVTSLSEINKRLEDMVKNGSTGEKEWANNILLNFRKYSPISLVVTLEQVKRGMELKSIDEAYNMEAQIVSGFMEDSDFFEGVRAMLIDKDNSPNWKYKSYKDLNEEEIIQKYFDRTEEIQVDPDKETV
jgi:3-hydroxyisobutyryl-CoA hydrolase